MVIDLVVHLHTPNPQEGYRTYTVQRTVDPIFPGSIIEIYEYQVSYVKSIKFTANYLYLVVTV